MLSNTLRGVALAASGISGSLGHGVAFLSLDSEYIRQRQQRTAMGRVSAGPSALTLLADDVWRGVVQPLQGVFIVLCSVFSQQFPAVYSPQRLCAVGSKPYR